MFQVNFQEGTKLAKNGTCRIKLPDDDAETMRVVNMVLHHRQLDISGKTDAPSLQNVAVTADKYACAGALSYWARVQLLYMLRAPGCTDTIDGIALFISYIFDFPDMFWAMSKRLILSKSKSLITSEFHYPTWGLDETARQILPQGLLGKESMSSCSVFRLGQAKFANSHQPQYPTRKRQQRTPPSKTSKT